MEETRVKPALLQQATALATTWTERCARTLMRVFCCGMRAYSCIGAFCSGCCLGMGLLYMCCSAAYCLQLC